MKNLVYIAVLAALGYTTVSCDTESVESIANESTNKKVKYEVSNFAFRVGDTITSNDTLTTNLVEEPGPGDDVVPIKPPKP